MTNEPKSTPPKTIIRLGKLMNVAAPPTDLNGSGSLYKPEVSKTPRITIINAVSAPRRV
jgi:hypothetical protein